MWLLLVASGYNAIANPGTGGSYQQFVFPGVIVMACLFGSALTAVSTVYDREFGMLRLMLASPAGPAVVLAGRARLGDRGRDGCRDWSCSRRRRSS